MKKIIKYLFAIMVVGIFSILFYLFNFNPTFASGDGDGSILVKFKDQKNPAEVSQKYNINESQIKEIPHINTYLLKTPTLWQKSRLYLSKTFGNNIEYIEPDRTYKIVTTPNDPRFSDQWALSKIAATSGWNSTTGSTSTTIAIVDTGINGTHEDLSGKVLAGHGFTNGGTTDFAIVANTDSDENGHGTAVSSVASATTNNSKGIAGVNWLAKLMPVRVFANYWWGFGAYSSDVALGITYAADNGAKVINMSLGSAYPSTAIEDAVNYAYNTKGAVLVAASGNENTAVSYPASYSNVIAVGATNSSDNRCSPSDWGAGNGSNYGPELDVVAPGNQVLSASDSSITSYANVSGTSIASPIVSGLAALVIAQNPSFSNTNIRSQILNNTDKVSAMSGNNFTNEYGYGRININKALGGNYSTDPSEYHHVWVTQNAYPNLVKSGSYEFSVTVRNTGVATWKQDVVHLGTSKPNDRIPFYTRGADWRPTGDGNRVLMQEAEVAPGADAHFVFSITLPEGTDTGTYREYFRVVADGVTWMEDYGIYWDINVTYPHYQYVSQSPHSADDNAAYVTVNPGEAVNLSLTVRNSGSTTWEKTSSHPVRLGTAKPSDRVSDFGRGTGWLLGSTNRVEIVENEVTPGQNGTFNFTMIAPATPGMYKEYFQGVCEFLNWMEDYGIYWNIKVE